MRILGVTGLPLAGKTTVARILEEEGFAILDMGDVVRDQMAERGLPVEETAEFVNTQREENGMDAIAQLCIPYLEELMQETDRIVITGMRGWSEKERFEQETGQDLEIVAVWASRETRQQRRDERQRAEDVDGQSMHERDMRDIRNGVGKLMPLSDFMILNDNATMETLENQVREQVTRT